MEGVPDVQAGGVHEADDFAGPGLIDSGSAPPDEVMGVLRGHRATGLRMTQLHPPAEHPGVHAHEGDLVAMGKVHARLDLEHVAGERSVERPGHPRLGAGQRPAPGAWWRRKSSRYRTADVPRGGGEQHGGLLAVEERLGIERSVELGGDSGALDRIAPELLAQAAVGGTVDELLVGQARPRGDHLVPQIARRSGLHQPAELPGIPRRASSRRPVCRSVASWTSSKSSRASRPGRSHLLITVTTAVRVAGRRRRACASGPPCLWRRRRA